jgi:hypothetical protein
VNCVSDLDNAREHLGAATVEGAWIGEAPVQALRHTREHGATLSALLVAYADNGDWAAT